MNLNKTMALVLSFTIISVSAVAFGWGSKVKKFADGAKMVKIEAGEFIMGDDGGEADERPAHKVTLKTYWIDVYEVSREKYASCVAAGKCDKPDGMDDAENGNLPVTGIDWKDAADYCAFARKRLPTEAEWEKAARGTEGRTYPWGENIDCSYANYRECEVGGPLPVGSYRKGAGPYKTMDMAGNVCEWVSDYYNAGYYKSTPAPDPTGPESGKYRVVRGGSFARPMVGMRSADRAGYSPRTKAPYIGFRCAMDDE